MITSRLLGINQLRLLAPVKLQCQTTVCLVSRCGGSGKSKGSGKKPVCPGVIHPPGGTGRGKLDRSELLVRAKLSGKCRLGFIPEEWFLFLYPKTGVSGPYILMIGLANYVASKEILVMEHEYYSGLSVLLVIYLLTTNFGRQIGAALDKEVQAVEDEWQKGRDQEIAGHVAILNECKLAQTRAQGQEILMAAKKENIAFQLEAVYRERMMMVYRAVRDRLQYHMKRSRTIGRIQQRWMVQWILENVNKSITPEFQKQALSSAIKDLAAAASQLK